MRPSSVFKLEQRCSVFGKITGKSRTDKSQLIHGDLPPTPPYLGMICACRKFSKIVLESDSPTVACNNSLHLFLVTHICVCTLLSCVPSFKLSFMSFSLYSLLGIYHNILKAVIFAFSLHVRILFGLIHIL